MIIEKENNIQQMFSDLTFDNQRHLYYWNNKKVPYSVSGIVNMFVPKFDMEKMSISSAIKQSKETGVKVTAHELKHKWQTINQKACTLGTNVHDFLEKYTGIQTPRCSQEEAGIKYIKELSGEYEISFRELRAYSKKFNFAGTMDIPLRLLGTSKYVIDDYKTNGDLFKAYDMLKAPFDFLESSAYNKYQIQLGLYQILLEDIGVDIINRRVVHLKADGTYKIYPLQDFTADLRYWLKQNKWTI